MDKSNMNKRKIAIIAVVAAIIIAGSITAAALIKNFNKAKDEAATSESSVSCAEEESYDYDEPVPQTAFDPSSSTTSAPPASTKKAKPAKKPAGRRRSKAKPTKKPAPKPARPVQTTAGKKKLVPRAITDNPLAGYRYDSKGDFYYTDDKDCWQRHAGYNEIYDKATPLTGMYIDQLRIRFTYENKDWMIQLWKGQYGFLFVGAEVGVYTAPAGTYTGRAGDLNHYNVASEEDWLKMQLDCYWSKNNDGRYKKVFTREYDRYWWATGFVKGQLTKYTAPRTELKVKTRITFKSKEMADLFVRGLRNAGFGRAASASALADDSYYQKGADVWVLWSSINQEAFAGYEGGPATTKPTTTKKPAETKPTTTTTKPTTTTTRPTTTKQHTTTEPAETTTESSRDGEAGET